MDLQRTENLRQAGDQDAGVPSMLSTHAWRRFRLLSSSNDRITHARLLPCSSLGTRSARAGSQRVQRIGSGPAWLASWLDRLKGDLVIGLCVFELHPIERAFLAPAPDSSHFGPDFDELEVLSRDRVLVHYL